MCNVDKDSFRSYQDGWLLIGRVRINTTQVAWQQGMSLANIRFTKLARSYSDSTCGIKLCTCVDESNTNKLCYYFIKKKHMDNFYNLQRSFKSPFLTETAWVVASRVCLFKDRGCWHCRRPDANRHGVVIVVVVTTRRRAIPVKAKLGRQETFLKHWDAIGIMPGNWSSWREWKVKGTLFMYRWDEQDRVLLLYFSGKKKFNNATRMGGIWQRHIEQRTTNACDLHWHIVSVSLYTRAILASIIL